MMQGRVPKFVAVLEHIAVEQTSNRINRARWPYLASAMLVLVLGFSARTYSSALPTFISDFAPDTLWALLVFLLVAAMRPGMTAWQTAWIALVFAYVIEFSQLYQAHWISAIRATRLGGLALGHGFLWSDLLCYGIGIGMGALFQVIYGRRNNHPTR